MTRLAALVLVALTLSACMGAKSRTGLSAAAWYKAGVSDEQRYQEVRYCRRTADRQAAEDYGVGYDEPRGHNDPNRTYSRQMTGYQAQRHRRDLFESCLTRYGYSRGTPKAPSGGATATDSQ